MAKESGQVIIVQGGKMLFLCRHLWQAFVNSGKGWGGIAVSLGFPPLQHGNNPIMNMCAANAVATRDPAGNRKLDKTKASGKIDGLVALAMALGASTMTEGEPTYSPWDDPSFTLAAE